MPQRPNILVFCTDQQRSDHLGCAGHPVLQTPSIDALAAHGVRFANCFTTYAACMPARGSMLTGLSPRACGMRSNGIPLARSCATLPSILRGAGYRTHSVGKLHLQPWHDPRSIDITKWECPAENPERILHWKRGEFASGPTDYYGFQTTELTVGHVCDVQGDYRVWLERHYPEVGAAYQAESASDPSKRGGPPPAWTIHAPAESHYNHWIADRSIAFLKGRDPDQPFFLWCSFPDPHEPFAAIAKWAEQYSNASFNLPERGGDLPRTLVEARGGTESYQARAEAFRERMVEYYRQTYGMISHVDEQIGRVMAELKSSGADENTLVVFLSDHGDELGEHGLMHKGYWPYDGNTRVPFIISGAGVVGPGRVVDDVVSLIDLAPTLLDFAGVAQADDPAVNVAYRQQLGRWLPPLPGDTLMPVLRSVGVRPGRGSALVEYDDELNPHFDLLQMRVLVTNEYKLCHYSPTNEVVLFDRRNDPGEMRNLATEPDYQSVVRDLLAKLMSEVNRSESRRPRRFSDA